MSLEALAQEHGGKQSAKFNQAVGLTQNWRKLIPESQGGVCGGLSLMWLAGQKHGLTADIFGKNKYTEAVFKYAEHAQQLGADGTTGYLNGIESVAKVLSLDRAGASIMVNNKNTAKWVCTGPGSLVFIALSNHAIAAQLKRPAIKFFEPNYGLFDFPTTLKFVLFFGDYLQFSNATARRVMFFK